ncbi:phage holin family protein [Aquimarina brevivitae]|uniref:Putative membrane protein n=1 Tax=Aquimarina brevivitae TaxID=323412 RepID=A0A4V2F773_9FLAO|nr:phage holin family protein [Aquimarina brevivitae]RZS98819.1 putative membrane protein [Aquimarina brevivitae]
MKVLLKIVLSAVVVLILAQVLPGVAVESLWIAIIVALVLALFNAILKPIFVILTLPVTIITLGLFLLVINAAIILLADYFIDGFTVSGWLWALIFSLLLSFFQSILHSGLKKD